MKQTKIMRTYYTNGIATFMKAEGGFLAVYDDEGNYSWGEFISDKDFNSDSFDQVEYEEADFTNQDAYYQRGMTEEIGFIHQEKLSIIPNHNRTMNTPTPTPRTDEVASHEGNWDTKALRMGHLVRTLERELTAVTEQRDEARRLAEKYRNLSCEDQDQADETLLPWENNQPERTMNTPTPTPTPRTDDAINWHKGVKYVEVSFTRKLERELTAATEQRDRLVEAMEETKKHLKDANRGAEINAHALRINADKLASVTEQRDAASAEFYRYHGLWDRATKQLETVMHQRDRLAEALQNAMEYIPSTMQKSAIEALQSLNQPTEL